MTAARDVTRGVLPDERSSTRPGGRPPRLPLLPLLALAAAAAVLACHDGAGPDAGPRFDRIAFERDSAGQGDVWVMNADGSGQRNLTRDPAHDDWFPAISPDGRRVAFTKVVDGGYELMVLDVDGTTAPRSVTSAMHDLTFPAWSPDGRRLVVHGYDPTPGVQHAVLYVMNVDGTGVVNVSAHLPSPAGLGNEEEASWSPDGRQLVVSIFLNGTEQRLYVADLTRWTLRPLTSGAVAVGEYAYDNLPAWSPDGRRVAFTRVGTGGTNVWAIDAGGSNERKLSASDSGAWGPAWSGDGATIAYVTAAGRIRIMSAVGLPGATLTDGTTDQLPTWSRP